MPEAQNPNVPSPPGAGVGEPRYKIGDVCRIADVQPYVLRYWESEFPALSPDRAQQGPRTYSVRELRIIEQIKKLLYDEGYTIAGAKKKLEAEMGGRAAEALPSAVPEPKPKAEAPRAREKAAAEPKGKPPKAAPELTELPFPEETVSPATGPARAAAVAVVAAPVPPAPDPRVGKTVAELREILKLLAR
ncbi:MAG TPA: MerR family transcriptional regulator [Thermoanaerobaculia bacterium]|nr:MerR family transcriptional regulator [Thermoanaerobaculia bacterium]HQR67128.1 MerR family transcriptional regulator [Thermoanaerobaculia bacterium]